MKIIALSLVVFLTACQQNKEDTKKNQQPASNQGEVNGTSKLAGSIEGKKWFYQIGIASIKSSDLTKIKFTLGSDDGSTFKCGEDGGIINSYPNRKVEEEAAMDYVSFTTPINLNGEMVQGNSLSVPDIGFGSFVGYKNGNGTHFPAKSGKVVIKKVTETDVFGYVEAKGENENSSILGDFSVKLCKPKS